MPNKYIDEKVTVWRRYYLPDDTDMNELVNNIKNGDPSHDWPVHSTEYILETEEQMIPDENKGCSTIEVYNGDNNLMWENGNQD